MYCDVPLPVASAKYDGVDERVAALEEAGSENDEVPDAVAVARYLGNISADAVDVAGKSKSDVPVANSNGLNI